jgi:ABC-type polar amino acid transport system ATPase subunit
MWRSDTHRGNGTEAMDQKLLEVRGVTKRFQGLTALDQVNLTVSRGEVVVVLGRSGSGKSTFVRCIDQLTPIDSGSIYLDGQLLGYERSRGRLREMGVRSLARQRSAIGMVFQHFNLFTHLTVLENMTLAPILVNGLPKSEAQTIARDLLAQVGLPDKADSYPLQLSGGQQQRVAIARMLAMKPRLLLFDEPTSALDPELVGEVLGVMRNLTAEQRTMIVVTHEIQFAREVADRVVFFEKGRVVADGSVASVIDDPPTNSLRAFFARAANRPSASNGNQAKAAENGLLPG